MVRAEPMNTRTTGIDTNHSTVFTLLLELNVICGQRWIQFELQNSRSRTFAIDCVATSRLALRWMHGSPRTKCARRTTPYICSTNKQQ